MGLNMILLNLLINLEVDFILRLPELQYVSVWSSFWIMLWFDVFVDVIMKTKVLILEKEASRATREHRYTLERYILNHL